MHTKVGLPGNVAADVAVRLGERAGDDVDAAHDTVALSDTRTVLAIHADGMDLVEEREGSVLFSEIANLLDRADAARH